MFGRTIVRVGLAISFLWSLACVDKKYEKDQLPFQGPLKTESSCALNFASHHLCADFNWEKHPTETDFGSLIVRFWDADDEATNPILKSPDQDFKVILWMPSMGHGSAPVSILKLGSGLYRIDRVFFTMRGDWEIRFQLKQGSEVVDQAVYSLTF